MNRRSPTDFRDPSPSVVISAWTSFVLASSFLIGIFFCIGLEVQWFHPQTAAAPVPMAAPCPSPMRAGPDWQTVEVDGGAFAFSIPPRFNPATARYAYEIARWRDPASRDEIFIERMGTKDPGAPRLYWGVSHGFFALDRCREDVAGQPVWIASAWGNSYPDGDFLAALATFRLSSGEYVRVLGITEPNAPGKQAEFLGAFRTVSF